MIILDFDSQTKFRSSKVAGYQSCSGRSRWAGPVAMLYKTNLQPYLYFTGSIEGGSNLNSLPT
jgi:hypothetical protein